MYENLEIDLDLKLLFMVTGAVTMKVVNRKGWVKIQQMYESSEFVLDLKLCCIMVTGAY